MERRSSFSASRLNVAALWQDLFRNITADIGGYENLSEAQRQLARMSKKTNRHEYEICVPSPRRAISLA